MLKFTANDWSSIVEREKFSLPGLKPEILKCLSDQDDAALATLFDEETGTLTAKGSYELASRLNAMLEADSFIAAFILKDVGNTQIFSRIGELICSDDKPIIAKLPDLPRIKDAFQSLRKYKDERCH
jgi:hypothetical protein